MVQAGTLKTAAVLSCVMAIGLGAADVSSAKSSAVPPLGRYTCYQFSATSGFLYWGFLKVLSSSTYRDGTAGPGRYAYSAATRKIRWLSGPYKRYQYKGEFQPKGTNGHKSDTIVLLGPEYVKIQCSIGK
jgi:hypothetical protein